MKSEFIKNLSHDDLSANILKDKYHYVIEFFVKGKDNQFKHIYTELTEDYSDALRIAEQYINGEYKI